MESEIKYVVINRLLRLRCFYLLMLGDLFRPSCREHKQRLAARFILYNIVGKGK